MNLRERWDKLKPRERILLLAAAACLIGVLLVLSLRGGGSSRKSGNRLDQVMAQEKKLLEVLDRYQEIHAQVAAIEDWLRRTPADFDMYKNLNQLVDQAGIRPAVIKMDPVEGTGTEYYREDYVDMNIQKVEFTSLVQFLQAVEESPAAVRINQLSLKKRFDNTNTLDATLRVSVYRIKEGT